ncbi:MAG: hypothetical protein H7Y30_08855 [Pyrinomonadaceae bacterium]|nr:hypothetical protein [Pyrinomonadaceae bacterium]
MKIKSPLRQRSYSVIATETRLRRLFALTLLILLTAFASSPALAQKQNSAKRQKLPSPEKIVNDYLKAIGGKKRVAAIKDASYEWTLQTARGGTATTQLKAPASTRMRITFSDVASAGESGQASAASASETVILNAGANARSAWMRDSGGSLRTLTDAEAHTSKLQSVLDASRLADYKKSNVLARTVGIDESLGEAAYIVEFSLRNGARLRYWFSVSGKLLLATANDTQKISRRFKDYKAENGLLEPHRVEWRMGAGEALILNLQSVRYNTSLSDSLFDPPGAEAIDVGALLRELDRNQEEVEERVKDYTYTEKRTERKINGRGEVTEETVKVFEIYPLSGRAPVRKLISENGVPLSAEKAAKEEKRTGEELEKAEREREKNVLKREREKQKGKAEKPEDDEGIADFLRAAELVSPRRESLRGREAIVFDFRPRAGHKPKGDLESIVSKVAGVVWIDPIDKQVMRLEARLIESYKYGGGLVANVRPGTSFIFEQKRMEDGVWLPVFTQVNLSAKVFLFKGIDLNVMQEFSNYQHFKSSYDDYNLTKPEEKNKP